MKLKLFIFVILCISTALHFVDIDLLDTIGGITGGVVTDTYTVQDEGTISVYFCPQDDCEGVLVSFLDSAKESIHCALFDIGLESMHEVLDKKNEEIDVKIVTDNDYLHKYQRDFIKVDTWSLMHNKFCIVDGKRLSTGSMNPTNNGAHKNNNNLLLIESSVLSQNYKEEFDEMWGGVFKKGDPVRNPVVKVGDVVVKNYFCPDDNCADHIKEELAKAQKSIHIMTFSFTHEGIANTILLRHNEGVDVKGVFEARQVSKYSKFDVLADNIEGLTKDGNKQNMHHKVFIVDGKTVITGSMNPSKGGDTRNDENVLVIEDEKIASLYVKEFEKVYGQTT